VIVCKLRDSAGPASPFLLRIVAGWWVKKTLAGFRVRELELHFCARSGNLYNPGRHQFARGVKGEGDLKLQVRGRGRTRRKLFAASSAFTR
jgi:hypothetical protein